MEIKDKFLPIGSVVLLKGGTKKAMITGFCSIAVEDKTKVYDYSGCVYPEGYLNSNEICLFDHDQIEELCFVGFENEEEKEFKDSLKSIISEYENGELELTDNDFFDDDEDDFDEEDDDDEEATDLEYL